MGSIRPFSFGNEKADPMSSCLAMVSADVFISLFTYSIARKKKNCKKIQKTLVSTNLYEKILNFLKKLYLFWTQSDIINLPNKAEYSKGAFLQGGSIPFSLIIRFGFGKNATPLGW